MNIEEMNKEMVRLLKEMLGEEPGLWEKRVYKATDCGAWISAGKDRVTLGSIVEGSHYDVTPKSLEWPFTSEEFWDALEQIEQEAQQIWEDTHGCEGCAAKWGYLDENGMKIDGCDGFTPIHPDCLQCKGEGVII